MAVLAAGHIRYPIRMVQIPLHSLAQTCFKGFLRPPAKLEVNFARVDSVPPVVPGAVFDKGDLLGITVTVRTWLQFIKQLAQGAHHLDIRFLIPAANVVGFTGFASLQHAGNGTAMVLHEEPVTDLHAVPVNRQRFTS